MIVEPPEAPAVMSNDSVPEDGVVTPARVGAEGVVRGVADVAVDASPSPIEFTASNFTL
ncbi:MAG: hypothetical protein ACO3IT_08690 [Ilumatobacteraceae bacterium]